METAAPQGRTLDCRNIAKGDHMILGYCNRHKYECVAKHPNFLSCNHEDAAMVMKVNGSFITEQEEVEVKKAKTFIWRPGKGLTEKVEAKISTLEDSDDFEDFQSENEDWESVDEYCSVATQTVFPEMKTVTQYEEEEDWDKEMADSENNKNSYDLDDIIYCGGFRDGNGEASYLVHEEPLYDPSLHHVAPLTLIHLKAVTEDGQFEDAVD